MARNALLELLQAASNAAAANVSGPVDLLGMGLRKLGIPVPEDAFGSSAWMAQRGLTREVQNPLLRVAGETLGMTAPVAMAARAPEVAAAVNRAIANLQAQRAAGPAAAQRGAIVWQGSPHRYDPEKLVRLADGSEAYVGGKFNKIKEVPPGAQVIEDYPLGRIRSEAIGTGEGAQAYGHGSYLAESKGVAKSYQDKLSKAEVYFDGKRLPPSVGDGSAMDMAVAAVESASDPKEALQLLKAALADETMWNKTNGYEGLHKSYSEAAKFLEKNISRITSERGSLYKVDLPDEAIARMLDWDAPLSQQAPEVQKAISAALVDRGITKSVADYIVANKSGNEALATLARGGYDARLNVPDGGMAADASRRLQQQGIPGIRYLDGGSRAAGAGSRNYVIFPGEENALLRILERNGQPLP